MGEGRREIGRGRREGERRRARESGEQGGSKGRAENQEGLGALAARFFFGNERVRNEG